MPEVLRLAWPWRPPRRVRPRPAAVRASVLAVDIGNSRITVALLRGDHALDLRHLPTRRHRSAGMLQPLRAALAKAGRTAAPPGAVLCSVVPALTAPWARALERAAGRPALVISAGTVRGMRVRYRDRATVGPDRLANAFAARALYGTPAIVVDLGTATNFDCVSKDGDFIGGVIAPGVATGAEALYARAARIARVTLRPQRRTLGRSTEEAVRAGILHGAAAMVDGIVHRLARDMNARPHVIATGGLATLVGRECSTLHHIDEGLTLKGLARIWEEYL